MKKIYLLLTFLLTIVGGGFSPAFAQDEPITIEVKKGIGDWLYANPARTWASQWQSDATPQVLIRESSNNNSGHGANNMAYWDGTNIEFFNCIGGSGNSDTYVISVEAGWEFVSIALDFKASHADKSVYVSVENEQSEVNESTSEFVHFEYDFASETTSFNFIVGASEPSKFAMTQNFVITVQKMNSLDLAIQEVVDAVTLYRPYSEEGAYPFIVGTEPGNYSAEAVATFNAMITECDKEEDWPDPLTEEYLLDLKDRLIAAYDAVISSKVPLTLADGYYRFRTAINYNDGEAKYMYVTNDDDTFTGRWGSIEDVENNCPSLFYISNSDGGTFDIVSMATDGRFNDITGNPVTLSMESENLMIIEPVATIDGTTYVDIKVEGQDPGSNNRIYIHQAGHGSGAGAGGTLTNWNPTYPTTLEGSNYMGATEWIVESVDAETAAAIIEAYGPIKDKELMKKRYEIMTNDAYEKLLIAKDNPEIDVNEEVDLITDVEQLSSPWTDPQEGTDIGALLDGDITTFWHSNWHKGSVTPHTHYNIDVALGEGSYNLISMVLRRRQTSSNHITAWSVYGSAIPVEYIYYGEDDELPAGKEVGDLKGDTGDWHKLASLSTPYSGDPEEIVTSMPFDTKGYKYLRFYIDGNTGGSGIGHMSEFQLHPSTMQIAENSQYSVMGALATNLEAVLDEQLDVTVETLTPEEYNALKAVYDPFAAKFVDPAELRTAISKAESSVAGIVVGNNPGEWGADTDAGALATVLAEAQAYDASGDYDAEKSAGYIEKLGTLSGDVLASANTIQPGKWYRIHFMSKETAENNDWDVDNNEAVIVTTTEGDIVTNEALWNKYFTVAQLDQEKMTVSIPAEEEGGEETEKEITINRVVAYEDGEVIFRNQAIYLDDDADITNKDMSLFRFVAVGDTAYVMQNKATGLFVGAYSGVRLDVIPSLIKVQAIGYGQNLIIPTNLMTNVKQSNLNAQRVNNIVTSYNETAPGSRSAFYLEEAGDVDASYDGTEFFMNLKPGSVNSFCYPMDIKPGDFMEFYDVVGVEDGVIKLNPITEVNAGRPFIFICDGDYVADADDKEPYSFYHGYELYKEAIAGPLLKGTYSTINLPKGALTTHADGFVVGESDVMSLYNVPAYTAYIQKEEMFSLTIDYTYEILDPALPDGMNTVLQKVAATGELYTIDGRLVSRNANLNDLKRFGKGLYILNGVKVVVK